MYILKNGFFSMPIKVDKGLRKVEDNRVNRSNMTVCSGVEVKDGILKRIQEKLEVIALNSVFPYPQIFIETNLIIVCTANSIYEYRDNNLHLEVTTAQTGSTWSLISVHDFVYMSNGIVAIVRDPISKVFSITEDQPTAMAICNYNGQVIIGAPNAGYNLGDT